MKNILFATIILLSYTSCHTHNEAPGLCISGSDYFEFGYSGGFAGIKKTFVIWNGNLYPNDTTQAPLPVSKYQQARLVIDNLPSYLLTHPNQQFSCANCADQFVIGIRMRTNGVIYSWNIDAVPEAIPVEIQNYEQLVYNTIESL